MKLGTYLSAQVLLAPRNKDIVLGRCLYIRHIRHVPNYGSSLTYLGSKPA